MNLRSLIEKRILELNIRRPELAIKIGYKNTNKGLRRIDDWAENGITDYPMISKLAKALEVSELEFIDATITTFKENDELSRIAIEKQKQIEKEAFQPYIMAMHQEREIPTQIMLGGMLLPRRKILLDLSFLDLPIEDRLQIAKEKIIEHFTKNEGQTKFWGDITHYILRDKYDWNIENVTIFESNGDIKNYTEGLRIFHGEASFTIGKKRIDFSKILDIKEYVENSKLNPQNFDLKKLKENFSNN
ncbi:MAG: hypothetical protein ACOVNU_00640 [Candidatus Kapaibacteriota bacterium]|jgi:hypothetical protein